MDNHTNTVSIFPQNIIVQTDERPIRNIGYLIIFITLGVFGLWSYFAPIDSSSLAIGSVSVKSHRKTVQHLDGGIIKRLLVKEGEHVNMGDGLILLDDTQIKAQLEILRSQFMTQKALSDRLQSERLEQKKIYFSTELLNLKDSRAIEAMDMQQQVFSTRKKSHQGEIRIFRQRVQQLNSKQKGLQAQHNSKQTLLSSYENEIMELKALLNEGFIDKQYLRDLQRKATITEGEIAGLSSEIAGTEMQRGETELEILQTERIFQEEIAHQLEKVHAKLFDVLERLRVIEDKSKRTLIRAPASGVVFNLTVHTEGGVIAPGVPIVDIVPEDEELIIRAQVSPMDIDRIEIGTPCEVRFSAFHSKTTPVMKGVLTQISADSLVNETKGISYYSVTVELTKNSRDKLGHFILVPGMPAEVLINTGEHTLFEYLMQPISDAFARAFIEE